MRALLGLVLLVAACRTPPRAPDIAGAPARVLESEVVREPATGRPATLRKCLFVFNHTKETVSVLVDGRHAGWVGPRSSAGLFVGRSAGAQTLLVAVGNRGRWEATVKGPVWDLSWHLKDGG